MGPREESNSEVRSFSVQKIKLGEKIVVDGNTCFRPAGYFICPEEVKKVFGERPKKLQILLPSDHTTQWVRHYFGLYSPAGEVVFQGTQEMTMREAIHRYQASLPKEELDTRISRLSPLPGDYPDSLWGLWRQAVSLYFCISGCPESIYFLNTCFPPSINAILAGLQEIRNTHQSLFLEIQERHAPKQQKPGYVVHLSRSETATKFGTRIMFPDSAIVLPPIDNEPPDDFYPEYSDSKRETSQQTGSPDLWARIKSRIYHLEIQTYQITRWFERNYHLDVDITDFDFPQPPAKFTNEMLAGFLQAIEDHVSL
ncbi:MAG: hypothetical protein JW712_02775 [Dehalococcoidales bacterium]|nr:hypothetical protein [Dehalococcoidales bacterium]